MSLIAQAQDRAKNLPKDDWSSTNNQRSKGLIFLWIFLLAGVATIFWAVLEKQEPPSNDLLKQSESKVTLDTEVTTNETIKTTKESKTNNTLVEFNKARNPKTLIPIKQINEEKNIAQPRKDRLASGQFTGHVYSENPAQRAVFINDQILRVGEIYKGLEILEITENGAVVRKTDVGAAHHQDLSINLVDDWSKHPR